MRREWGGGLSDWVSQSENWGSRKVFLTEVRDEILHRKGDFLSRTRKVARCYSLGCFCPSSLNRRIQEFLCNSDDHPWVRFPWLSALWSAKRQGRLPRELVSPFQWLPWIQLCNEAVCRRPAWNSDCRNKAPLPSWGHSELLKLQVS